MKRSPLKRKPPSKSSPAKKAFKKAKQQSVNWWKKKAWATFSKWIRHRDNYTCYTCGSTAQREGRSFMHAGHFIPRQSGATFFDEVNNHAQCYACNILKNGNHGAYVERLINDYGIDAFQELLKRGKQTKQFTVAELQEIITKYTLDK